MAEIREFDSRLTLATTLAEAVVGHLKDAIAARGRATLAVPGGTTPGPFLMALALHELDWSQVAATLTDERWVPPDHPRSNARLLGRTLLIDETAAIEFVPLYAEAETPDAVVAEVSAAIQSRILPLDICVLGMGTDMHVASLFPGADRLAEALSPDCASPVLPIRAPGADETRMTLTLPSILSARHIFILITGPEKMTALETALGDGPVADGPARAILRGDRPVTVYYAP